MAPARIEDFATLVSCRDFRVEEIEGLDRRENWVYAKRVMEKAERGELYVKHMSFLRPLGVESLIMVSESRELRRAMLSLPRGYVSFSGLDSVLPLARLLDHILVSGSGTVIVWHRVPGVDYAPVLELAARFSGEVYQASRYPVHTCKPGPRLGDAEELASRLMELRRVPVLAPRSKLLAFSIIALLDEYRMKPLKKLLSTTLLAHARELETLGVPHGSLRLRYVLRYYRELSRNYVLGRYRILPSQELQKPKALITAEPEQCSRLYGYLAYRQSSAYIYCGETALATTTIDNETVKEAQEILDLASTNLSILYRAYAAPFPFELYDPLTDHWHTEPVPDVLELLRKLGYIH